MTTITCDRSTMACDSQITVGDVKHPGQKVWVFPGMIVGIAGEGAAMGMVIDWFERGSPKDKPDIEKRHGSVSGLVLTRDGIFEIDAGLFFDPVKRSFHAVGTGAGPALGAMMAGKSVAEAVDIACDIDSNSGRPVRVYKLADVPPAPRKKRKS